MPVSPAAWLAFGFLLLLAAVAGAAKVWSKTEDSDAIS